jgi:N-acyl-phosphatidylethanolamine-hydrolysing phospholipase D
LRATWLGHACFYVEFPGGLRVLFDPVFDHRCSPFSFMGPARYTEAPCQIDDIPIIDAVIISHNHYDHLSHPTILKIREKHPHAHFFAPLGNKKWFTASGIHNMTELDWWETRELRLSKVKQAAGEEEQKPTVVKAGAESGEEEPEISATIGCLPCQHMSARTPFDKAHTLWGSWSVESGGKKLWFAG